MGKLHYNGIIYSTISPTSRWVQRDDHTQLAAIGTPGRTRLPLPRTDRRRNPNAPTNPSAPSVYYGKPIESFTVGETMTVSLCDVRGESLGPGNHLLVYVKSDRTELDISKFDAYLDGPDDPPTETDTGCSISTSAIIKFAQAQDSLWYCVDAPHWKITNYAVDAANKKFVAQIQWMVGGALSNLSDWIDIHQGDTCTTPVGGGS